MRTGGVRAVDIYRALLWCYPGSFRDEYGAAMADVFTEQLREARLHDGRRGAAAIWASTLLDLIPSAFREHRHVIQQDLRHAVRILATNPGFTVVAVLSLALGIGANGAIFSLLNSVMMSTLAVRDPHELVMLTDPGSRGVSVGVQRGDRSLLTYTEFRQLQAQRGPFASLMASSSALQRTHARIGGSEPEEMAVRLVSTSYFAMLGVPARLGQTFDAGPEPAEGTVPYAVISYEYWQRRFGGRPDVLGRAITFRDGVVSVIGVAPASFLGETVGERPDVWAPLAMQRIILPGREWLRDRPGTVDKVMWLHAFGRLGPGVTLERAQTHVNVIFQQGLADFYSSMGDATIRARFLDQRVRLRAAATGASSLRGAFAEPLVVLLGAAGLVLLIACSNLGNLLLARTTTRQREMALRLALGASRGRLIRQLLTESICLATLGGLAGLVMAVILRQGLLSLVADSITLPDAFDRRVLGFVFCLTLAAGLLLGLLPALRITKTQAVTGLREQGRGIAGSLAWLRLGKLVVVGQLALSLPLLAGAGLLVRTLINLQQVDLGFPKDHVLMVRVDGEAAGYDPARQALAFDTLLASIRALPGVRVATYSNNGLFAGSDISDEVIVDGYTRTGRDDRGTRYDQVGPGYFSTLGIPVVLGREITAEDRAGGRTVGVINETFAKRFFAGRNPLGLHVTLAYAGQRYPFEIVGVVRDSRQSGLRGDIEHRLYIPATQPSTPISDISFIIRPRGEVSNLLTDVRRVIHQAEPKMVIADAGSLSAALDQRLVHDRLLAQLSIAFGVVAVLLAAIGLYGVLSYGVARRTNEIGLRKALGAQHRALIAMIVRETGWLVLLGLLAGIAVSVGALRLIASRVYGLSVIDPVTFAGAIAGLALIAGLATWLPAYRASRVDPLVALRQQ